MGKIEHPERLHLEAARIEEDGEIVAADFKSGEGRGETQAAVSQMKRFQGLK